MKREQVRERHAEGHISATHVIQNPANPGEWIVFFFKKKRRAQFFSWWMTTMKSSPSAASTI